MDIATEACPLPLEVLELIIGHLSKPPASIALPASDDIIRTLCSLTLVCKATYATSLKQLYESGLHIDSSWRLQALVRSYASKTLIYGRNVEPSEFRQAASTSMFLAPFSSNTIDEMAVIDNINPLFTLLANHLRRLVIDMPLRSVYPDDTNAHLIRPTLREAFLQLQRLEDFMSVRDELYLETTIPRFTEPPVWSSWQNLRLLALYNLNVDEDLAMNLNRLTSLKTLVLTRPDTMETIYTDLLPHIQHLERVIVVNTLRCFPQVFQSSFLSPRSISSQGDGNGTRVVRCTLVARGIRARKLELLSIDDGPEVSLDEDADYDDIEVCQLWTMKSVLDGALGTLKAQDLIAFVG